MKASERGFRDDATPEQFAAAMTKCEGYAPSCHDLRSCQRDGACFKGPPNLEAARMIERQLLPTDGRAGMHFAYLRQVARLLREGKIAI